METVARSTARVAIGAAAAPGRRPRGGAYGNGRGPKPRTCRAELQTEHSPLGKSDLTTPRFAHEPQECLNHPGAPRSLPDPVVNAAEAAVWALIERFRDQARHCQIPLCEYLLCENCYLWDPAAFGCYGRSMCRCGAEYVGVRTGRPGRTRERWVRMDQRDGLFVCQCGQPITGEGAALRVCPRARYRGRGRRWLHHVSGPYFRKARIFKD